MWNIIKIDSTFHISQKLSIQFPGAVPVLPMRGLQSTNADADGLTCRENEYVRYEKTGCDRNTCAIVLASGPRACAQYIAKITWCDCKSGFFRNSAGNCVTQQQCQAEKDLINYILKIIRSNQYCQGK